MDFRHSSACLTVPSLSQDTWKFVTSLLLRLTSKYQDGLVLDFRFIKRKIRLLLISATLAHGMMAIMLGGAQFLRWSGLWNLCTEQFVRNVFRRKYSSGDNTEKRRLKRMIKNGLERQLRLWSKSKSPCHDNNCIFWCEMMLNEARDVLCREKKFTYEQNGRKWFDDKIVPSSFLTQMKKYFLQWIRV